MAGAHERLLGHEVGGREAQLATALVAVGNDAGELEARTEQTVGLRDLPGQHETANVAGGDDLAIDLQQRVHDGREALIGEQQAGIALSLVPEAEVLADRDLTGTERADEHVVDELRGGALGELGVEGDHDQLLDTQLGEQLGLALERRQQLRRVLRRDHRDGMGLEA